MSNSSSDFKAFALIEMQARPETIKKWAAQDENPLLKQLSQEVIKAARQ